MEPMRTLFTVEPDRKGFTLPDGLRATYDGDLYFPVGPGERPYVIENFVETLDGVVSFNLPGQSSGGEISGRNEADRFIMGLLRASADAVLVGSGTVRCSGMKASWTPEAMYPAAKDLYWQFRNDALKKPDYPLVVILSAAGNLDLNSSVFHTPRTRVLIMTTDAGEQKLAQSGSGSVASVEVKAMAAGTELVSLAKLLKMLKQEFGVGLLLNEGGPTVFGELLAGGLVDELFLTVAPQIAGRVPAHPRPSLIEGVEFAPQTAPWPTLLTAKKAGDHLYLRYLLKAAGSPGGSSGS